MKLNDSMIDYLKKVEIVDFKTIQVNKQYFADSYDERGLHKFLIKGFIDKEEDAKMFEKALKKPNFWFFIAIPQEEIKND